MSTNYAADVLLKIDQDLRNKEREKQKEEEERKTLTNEKIQNFYNIGNPSLTIISKP